MQYLKSILQSLLTLRCFIVLLVILVVNSLFYSQYFDLKTITEGYRSNDLIFHWQPEDHLNLTSFIDNPIPANVTRKEFYIYSCKQNPVPLNVYTSGSEPGSQPYIFFPDVSKAQYVLFPGQPLCIRIAIPPLPVSNQISNRAMFFPLLEPPGNVWEQLMVWTTGLTSKTVRVIDMRMAKNQPADPDGIALRDDVHVYEGELILHNVDSYDLLAAIEYRDAQWNFEREPPVKWEPIVIQLPAETRIHIIPNPDSNLGFKDYRVHLTQTPLCQSADETGQWIPSSLVLPKGKDYEGRDYMSLFKHTAALDEQGQIWAPFKCHYRHIEYTEFRECLKRRKIRTIHWYGESHTRRLLKQFASLGKFCNRRRYPKEWANENEALKRENSYLTKELVCDCDDNEEPYKRVYRLNESNGVYEVSWLDTLDAQKEPAEDDPRIRWFRIGGLTDIEWARTATWQEFMSGPAKETPDLVVLGGLGNWDAAFLDFREYQQRLDKFLDIFQNVYGRKNIPIYFRTAQYFCCNADDSSWKRKFSTLRVETFDIYTRKQVKKRLNAKIWDVYEMGKHRILEQRVDRRKCSSNHVEGDRIEWENQVFMNAICNS